MASRKSVKAPLSAALAGGSGLSFRVMPTILDRGVGQAALPLPPSQSGGRGRWRRRLFVDLADQLVDLVGRDVAGGDDLALLDAPQAERPGDVAVLVELH